MLSEFTFFIMVIFLPGIVAYKVVDELTVHKENKTHEVIVSSFIYGFISYLSYYFFFSIYAWFTNQSFIFHLFSTLDAQQNIHYGEIFWVTAFGIGIGVLFTLLDTYKIPHWIAKSLRIIYKHGDLDTFTYLMRSNLKNQPWAVVRDVEDDRAYAGWIAEFSNGDEPNELFLRDVVVFQNSTGDPIMTSPGIYLAKPKEKYVIEFPDIEYSDKMNLEIVHKEEEKWEKAQQEKS